MSNKDSLADTIVPRSDQLNADNLLCGPITVTVKSVKRGDNQQPVVIEIDGGHQPYKPCKGMRRVLIAAWGDKGADWVGKSMTLFCNPEVIYGGVKVGGIQISHLSHIESDTAFNLTVSRGKRVPFLVKKLVMPSEQPKPKQAATVKEKYAAAEQSLRTANQENWLKFMKHVKDHNLFSAEQKAALVVIGDGRGRELGLVS